MVDGKRTWLFARIRIRIRRRRNRRRRRRRSRRSRSRRTRTTTTRTTTTTSTTATPTTTTATTTMTTTTTTTTTSCLLFSGSPELRLYHACSVRAPTRFHQNRLRLWSFYWSLTFRLSCRKRCLLHYFCLTCHAAAQTPLLVGTHTRTAN